MQALSASSPVFVGLSAVSSFGCGYSRLQKDYAGFAYRAPLALSPGRHFTGLVLHLVRAGNILGMIGVLRFSAPRVHPFVRPPGCLLLMCALIPLAGFCQEPVTDSPEPSMPTFGTTVVVPFGLLGEIYRLPQNAKRLPDFGRLEPVGKVYTNALQVGPRDFAEGFPGVTDRFEWFAIDYNGRFWIEKPGNYRFSLTSDDGAKLHIDGREVIDNDGVHPPRTARGSIRLSGGIHRIRVSYFQGPRFDVALVLRVASPGEKWRVFDTNEFKPPPNPANWKYSDPSDLTTPRDPNADRLKLRDALPKPPR